jgi:hypothetical protein
LADDILCWLLPKGKRVAWIAENSGSVENLQIDKLPKILHTINWLVVSTPLKNISQLELLFPIYGKNVPDQRPDYINHLLFGTFSTVESSFQRSIPT